MLCEWFNNNAIQLTKSITQPEQFKCFNIHNNYKDSLTEHNIFDTNYKFNIFNNNEFNGNIIKSHKYLINFTTIQSNILKLYFNECLFLYNFCVDLWTDYKEITSNWQLLKDIIFKYLYRTENGKINLTNTKIWIIEKLKEKQIEYDINNEVNKDEITRQKLENNLKYKNEMKQYKIDLKANKLLTVKKELKKPKRDKVKINKIIKPRKERDINIKKPAPDDTLKSEIKEFCTNLSNARNKSYENKTPNIYELRYKTNHKSQTITISNRAIGTKGICSNALGKLECSNYQHIIKTYNIEKECKLSYDTILKKYHLSIILDDKPLELKNRKEVVAIDEGEKTFVTFFSNNENGKLGDNMRVKILRIQQLIIQYEKILKSNKNKKGKSIKNKKIIKIKIRKLYLKIKGYVDNIHKKTAKFLCENYENILLPKFETKPMISNNKIEKENERIKLLSNVEGKIALRKLKKTIRLSKKVKFVLSMQSHYRFKQYLKAKAKKYKTNIYDVDEAYTSQTCTMCGMLSKVYDNNRIKECSFCKYKIDRDINGSRNILLKCINELSGVTA